MLGFQAVFGQRGEGERRQANQRAAAVALKEQARRTKEARLAERKVAIRRARNGGLPRFAHFRPQGGPGFFWTTASSEGFFLSGTCEEDWNGTVLPERVESHKLRREAKARALALREGWLLAKGRER